MKPMKKSATNGRTTKPAKGSARAKRFMDGGTVGALAGLGTLAYLLSRGKDKDKAPDIDFGKQRAMDQSAGRPQMGDGDRSIMFSDKNAKRTDEVDDGKRRALAQSAGRPEMGDGDPAIMNSDRSATENITSSNYSPKNNFKADDIGFGGGEDDGISAPKPAPVIKKNSTVNKNRNSSAANNTNRNSSAANNTNRNSSAANNATTSTNSATNSTTTSTNSSGNVNATNSANSVNAVTAPAPAPGKSEPKAVTPNTNLATPKNAREARDQRAAAAKAAEVTRRDRLAAKKEADAQRARVIKERMDRPTPSSSMEAKDQRAADAKAAQEAKKTAAEAKLAQQRQAVAAKRKAAAEAREAERARIEKAKKEYKAPDIDLTPGGMKKGGKVVKKYAKGGMTATAMDDATMMPTKPKAKATAPKAMPKPMPKATAPKVKPGKVIPKAEPVKAMLDELDAYTASKKKAKLPNTRLSKGVVDRNGNPIPAEVFKGKKMKKGGVAGAAIRGVKKKAGWR
jgi:hypothetical protein